MIQAFTYRDKQFQEHTDPASLEPFIQQGDPLWMDFEEFTESDAEFLRRTFDFHPLALEDCAGDISTPKVEIYDSHLFIVVHAIRFDIDTERFSTVELDLFVGKNYVVSVHKAPVRSIQTNLDKCRRMPDILGKGSDFLLYSILDTLVDNYGPILEDMDDLIEILQDEVLADPGMGELRSVFALKRSLLYLRRVIQPQRDTINSLARGDYALISKKNLIYFRDIFDHLSRYYESTENMRELVSSTLELYVAAITNRTNEVMKVLAIVATVMMPATLVASIYGMNFEIIPLAKHPLGFFVTVLTIVGISATMLYFFRRKHWF